MTNKSLFLKPDFIRTVSQNGVGRYITQLQRVVLKFCKNNGSSRGMRDFIESELVHFARENPGICVYLKPRRHRGPVIKAEYLNGDSQWVNCANFSNEEIIKWLNLLKSQQNDKTGIRYRKLWHTDTPSIQGPWTPYTFRDSNLNLVNFPDNALAQPFNVEETLTEQLAKALKK
ncbi:unnamed protein product [Brassicogethes aeneus]|uniref:Large ribosomal subunit protein mL43 n=1 Tax=Brassicogethes aeneus TaxID=1431903 RepID=A0A9P0B3F2_BRAAE|nr:unnamed protein product [Brassicogethes aeneus]